MSSGLAGLFGRQVLVSLGATGGLGSALFLAFGIAGAFAALQLLYIAFVRLVEPTRAQSFFIIECISQSAALVLIPFMLELSVPWPHPAMEQAEPLVYLALFAAPHLFFKLMSFYAAIRGTPAPRWPAVVWLCAAATAGFAGYSSVLRWTAQTELARPKAPENVQAYRVGDAYAAARVVPEGSLVSYDVASYKNNCLTFYWANIPDAPDDAEQPEVIYVTVTCKGAESMRQSTTVKLDASGWTEMVFRPAVIPPDIKSCTVTWDASKRPAWQDISGIRPVITTGKNVLMAGPFKHELAAPETPPNIVLIEVDGLAAGAVGVLGYKKPTAPSLDRFAQGGYNFINAYTPAPDSAAAAMTILSGVNPVAHGYTGGRRGALPKGIETLAELLRKKHYCTGAFTEGEAAKDLLYGSGFERGFDSFDSSWREEASEGSVGSKRTLQLAREWAEERADRKFLLFVRLGELSNPRWHERYGSGMVSDTASATPRDVYDAAVAYLDKELGAFIKTIRALPAGRNTCILVTSSYGFEFQTENAAPKAGLSEDSLHVPLMLFVPGMQKPEKKPALVSLEDVAPTLLRLAQTGADYKLAGRDLINDPRDRAPVAVAAEPLALSIRVERWRFTMQIQTTASGTHPAASESLLEFYDVPQAKRTGVKKDAAITHPELVAQYRDRLRKYLDEYRQR